MTLPSAIRRWFGAAGDRAGTVSIEFAIIAPVLLLLVLGTFQFGIVISNYVVLTDAVGTGARQLSLSRGDSTPYTDTQSAITGTAANLTASSITITMTVNGTLTTVLYVHGTPVNGQQYVLINGADPNSLHAGSGTFSTTPIVSSIA